MTRVFISYSRKDIDFARHLRHLLQDQGFAVWMDETGLGASERWWPTIEKNIIGCGAFIVIMSPDAQSSDWVEREILVAENPDHKKPIFPVLLRGKVWSRLANIHYEDMQAGLKAALTPDFVRRLEAAVPRSASSPPPAPPPIPGAPLQIGRSRRLLKWIGGGALATIIALILAFLALFPEQTRTEWFQALGLIGQSATPTTAPTDAPRPTDTPAAPTDTRIPATPVPFVPTGAPFPTAPVSAVLTDAPTGEAALRLITSPDTLTIVVQASASVDLRGLNLRYEDSFGAVVTRHPADDFDVLALTGGMAEPGACFVYREAGSRSPLADACTNTQKVFRREVTRADVFWYDFITNRPRDLVILREGIAPQTCSGSAPECIIAYSDQAALVQPAATQGYPCAATITTARGNPIKQLRRDSTNDRTRYDIEAGRQIIILDPPTGPSSDQVYRIADAATQVQLGWIGIEYVSVSPACPILP
ncbi:MAG: hypothetical protein BroJett038_30030 [Chloroflexota bacterium]|nr:MAG: hypothetical protein BroJett038_30030 [Chloroflexota bacterium]